MRTLHIVLTASLVACGSQSDGPPASVEVHGDLVGVFYSSTSLDVDPPSTTLVMSVSRVMPGCDSIELDRNQAAPYGQQPISVDRDEQGIYAYATRGTAPSYDFEGWSGDDWIHATLSAPAAFDVAVIASAVGQPGRVTWTIDPTTAAIEVTVAIDGPGGHFELHQLPDSGALDIPGTAFSEPGEYAIRVEKSTGHDTWWCTEFDSSHDYSACCGFWSASIYRRASMTLPATP
jgi:hypothetical protein